MDVREKLVELIESAWLERNSISCHALDAAPTAAERRMIKIGGRAK